MSGQVPVVQADRAFARALGGIDAQLVADVGDVLGHTPAAADVMDACRYWSTSPPACSCGSSSAPTPHPPKGGD